MSSVSKRTASKRAPYDRITVEQVAEVLRRLAAGESTYAIARTMQISRGSIYHIKSGRTTGLAATPPTPVPQIVVAAAAKLTADAVREIQRRLLDGDAQSRIARDFAITPVTVRRIRQGKTWGWLTGWDQTAAAAESTPAEPASETTTPVAPSVTASDPVMAVHVSTPSPRAIPTAPQAPIAETAAVQVATARPESTTDDPASASIPPRCGPRARPPLPPSTTEAMRLVEVLHSALGEAALVVDLARIHAPARERDKVYAISHRIDMALRAAERGPVRRRGLSLEGPVMRGGERS